MRLLLVRHGQSEWNAARRLQGQADIALSDKGRAQARALAPVIAAIQPDAVVASDLSRASETARLIWPEPATLTPALREINVGDWTGADVARLEADVPQDYQDWRAGTFAPPGGEIWASFRARIVAAIADAPQSGNLLVVCHGGVIRAVMEHFLNIAPAHIIPVGPASLTSIHLNGCKAAIRLELFNYSAGVPEFEAPD
jgi:glucosyl-3-phosphoglycerate phosphatase